MYRLSEFLAERMARGLALGGGFVLVALIALTCVSIIGRALLPLDIGLGPIRGIYDLTEIGMAVAIFAFLPWAQFTEAHARVDLFQNAMPGWLNLLLDVLFNAAMAFVAIVGTWRLYLGMRDKLAFGDTTIIMDIPVWQSYAASLVGAAGFVFVSLFCVIRATRRLAGLEEAGTSHVGH